MATITVEWAGSGIFIGRFIVRKLCATPCGCDDAQCKGWRFSVEHGETKCTRCFSLCQSPSVLYDQARYLQEAVWSVVKLNHAVKQARSVQYYVGHEGTSKMTHPSFWLECPRGPSGFDRWQPDAAVLQAYEDLSKRIIAESCDIVLAVTKHDKRDLALAQVQYEQLPDAFTSLSNLMKADLQVVTAAVSRKPSCIKAVPDVAKTKEVMLCASSWMTTIRHTPQRLLGDKDYFVQWAMNNYSALECFPLPYRFDQDVVLAGLGALFKQEQRSACELACGLDVKRARAVDYRQRAISSNVVLASWFKDTSFMLKAVRVHPFLLNKAPKTVRNDYNTALAAMQNNGLYLHLEPRFRTNKTILQAVLNNPNALPRNVLKNAGSTLQEDLDFVLSSVRTDGLQLAFASATLRANQVVVQEACKNNYKALRHACPTLQQNIEFMLKCCQQDGRCLTFACSNLRENIELARVAVNQCPVWFVSQAAKARRT